jgi:glucose/arabinose dehydrogenase
MRRLACAAGAVAGLALSAPAAGAAVTLESYGTFSAPTYVASPPGDTTRIFVVEKAGKIKLVSSGVRKQFIDLTPSVSSGGERGLLSMAFDPDYATNGRFYVFYTAAATGNVKIEEFKRSAIDPDVADGATRRNLVDVPHAASNHNGGQLQIGPDGALYATIGDNAVSSNAQSTANPYGKVLRVDKELGGYGVWSYGLRNPWRFSFDSNDLVIGDVGSSGPGVREEINYVQAPNAGQGVNFGWPVCEGPCSPANPAMTDPVLSYGHPGAECAITGGYVVRASFLPTLDGRYVYGDYCAGKIRSTVLGIPNATGDRDEGLTVSSLYSFGLDACAQLYATSGGGGVYRFVENAPPGSCPTGAAPAASAELPPAAPPVGPPGGTEAPVQPPEQPPGQGPGGSGPGGGTPAGPGGPTAVDAVAPRLRVGFRLKQRAVRVRAIVLRAACDEPCRMMATGTVAGARTRRALKLRAATAQLRARRLKTFRLQITRADATVIARALARGARVVARIQVAAIDAAGNRRSRSISVRIAR